MAVVSMAAGCAQASVDQAAQVPDLVPPTAPAPKQNFGPYAVGVRTETFVDSSRPTDPSNGAPGKPSRTLRTLVLYPAQGEASDRDVPDAPPAAEAAPFPLIEFSHGFTASGPAYTLLLRQFAAAGYVVAAPTFPLSSGGTPGGPNVSRLHEPTRRRQLCHLGDAPPQQRRVEPVAGADRPRQGGGRRPFARCDHHVRRRPTTTAAATSASRPPYPISGLQLPFPGGTFFAQPDARRSC